MKKTILFDLDGTLTDSGEGIINCAVYALERLGLPIPSREALRVFVGPPLHETFQKFGVSADQAAEAVSIFRSRYIPIGIFENAPYPHICELLEELKSSGHTLYVATSKPEPMAIKILTHFDMAKYFDKICGATMDTTRVTKEDVISYLLSQCSSVENAIMVGDTKYDIIGAKAHGIPAVGVSWGYGDVQEMKDAGALCIAHSTEELQHFLQE